MTRTLYALLVGIDAYQPPVRQLRGCVNDITAIDALLRDRLAGDGTRYEPLLLLDADATRQQVIDGFRQHLSKAGQDDVALFYYSGHGSQEQAPPEFWSIEPDKLDETLVCFDSRADGRHDLADKELAKLIEEVAAHDPHVLIVLDCCHSASGTRDIDEENLATRRAPTDTRPRPIDSFIVSADEAIAMESTATRGDTRSDWVMPRGKHVLLAGCRADQESKEYADGEQRRGAFSFFLTQTLQSANAPLSYRDLFARASALVRANISNQAPQIEATNLDELDGAFLGGAIGARVADATVRFDRQDGWVIDRGAIHGIRGAASSGETTRLALYAFDATADQMRNRSAAIGEARVTAVQPQHSTVTLDLRGAQPDQTTTYKAVITSLPESISTVRLSGDDSGVGRVRAALAGSKLVREAKPGEAARLVVMADDNRYRIARGTDPAPLTADVAGFTDEAAVTVVQRLEHIAQWDALAERQNPASRIPATLIRLEAHRIVGPPTTRDESSAPTERITDPEIRLRYTRDQHGAEQQPQFKLRIVNESQERLYCALLDMTQLFKVEPGLFAGGGVWVEPGQQAWALDGGVLYASVPDALWTQGVTEFRDLIKLIASTEQFDATTFKMDPLEAPTVRDIGGAPRAVGADWITRELTITTVRPRESTPVSSTQPADLGNGVTIAPHPALKAEARLSTLSESGRDLGTLALPPLLRDDPDAAQPFEFTTGRAGTPGPSVLALDGVADHTVVTPEQPLLLHVDQPLGADEHVLALGFDGEFYLPLGAAVRGETAADSRGVGGTTIRLDRLPAPGATRDLLGSIRIFFQKIVAERVGKPLGIAYQYPLLAAAYVDQTGTLTTYARAEEVTPRVAAADRVLLYIHGIIGDTRGLARSARLLGLQAPPPLPPALIERYDLVLTFDYENINTRIEETARALKQRLAAVGLGPDHGKTLHVVAHSMGGLVARWFIEREGGVRVVQRLVMLGTPNQGSPWPTLQSWATTAIGIGLNGLSTIAWPVKLLGSLVGAIETVDVTLDQMAPGSDFLKDLAASDDPGVPYTIIAGNTSIIREAQQPDAPQRTRLQNLLARITPQKLLHSATALAFLLQPNDIAVSVQSITGVPTGRSPQPVVREVACDHITYFTTVAGLKTLAELLPES